MSLFLRPRFAIIAAVARRLRVQFPGAIYHVTHRGVEKRLLFEDDYDRHRYIRRLAHTLEHCKVRLYLFCLMPNHVHLVLETPQANVSRFMHRLETAYCVYFNLRHQRTGHLMQGRFGAQLVTSDSYLLRLTRYVHLNPVRTKATEGLPFRERVETLRAFRWSSYSGYVGQTSPYPFIDEGPLLALVGGEEPHRRCHYREYVEAGLVTSDDELKALLRSGVPTVGEVDLERTGLTGFTPALPNGRIGFRAIELHPSASRILQAVSEHFGIPVSALKNRRYRCPARAMAAFLLARHAGLSQREIGRLLSVGTGAAVSQQLRRLEEAAQRDRLLLDQVSSIERQLRQDC